MYQKLTLLLIFVVLNIQACPVTFNNIPVKVSLRSRSYLQTIYGCITPDKLQTYNKHQLLKLSVANQNIDYINAEAIANFTDQFAICFNKNGINGILPGAFSNLYGLNDINFSSNKITTIPAGIFANLRSLKTIGLNNNNISCIDRYAFRNLLSLNHVYLSHNELNEFNQRWFKHTPNLKTLDLAHNFIKKIEESSFSGLTKIKVLTFSHNEIEFIDKYAFCDLTNLIYLNLGHNKLKQIDVDFSRLVSMRRILLHLNQLIRIPEEVLESFHKIRPQLKHVILHSNPILCECYSELEDWCFDNNVILNYNEVCSNLVCVNPDNGLSYRCKDYFDDDIQFKLRSTFFQNLNSSCEDYELVDNVIL